MCDTVKNLSANGGEEFDYPLLVESSKPLKLMELRLRFVGTPSTSPLA
jgi:hypothetical protein